MRFGTSVLWALALFSNGLGSAETQGPNVSHGKNSMHYSCAMVGEEQSKVQLQVRKNGDAFDVLAYSVNTTIFRRTSQRPSLNVRVTDEKDEVINEFIDFNDEGLEVIPIGGTSKLEVDLYSSPSIVHYGDETKTLQLKCSILPAKLIAFLDIAPIPSVVFENTRAVAFDIDDTLMFTSPAFARGFATGGLPKPDDTLFWTHTNGCDSGCSEATITLADGTLKLLPANAPSTPKAKALELIRYHKNLGHRVYAITARPDINGEPLREYVENEMEIDREDVFFEPDMDQPKNIAGKTDRIENLDLDVFYGDSDSDIADTLRAFVDEIGFQSKRVHPVRFLRSPKSSNRKAGELNKYHPGYFGETILGGSY